MREIRLFVEAPLREHTELALPATAAGHALRVLRLRAGDAVTLFNGDGREYAARLLDATGRVSIERGASPVRESWLAITLVQALARGEKMDFIVQKATELGAVRIVPVATERSEVRLDAARSAKRREHWRAVAIAACEQCGRNVVPEIDTPTALGDWLADDAATPRSARWMLHPDANQEPSQPSATLADAAIAIGPEGGFGTTDVAALRTAGYRGWLLGPRTLRTETAGLAALAALQTLYGDFGSD